MKKLAFSLIIAALGVMILIALAALAGPAQAQEILLSRQGAASQTGLSLCSLREGGFAALWLDREPATGHGVARAAWQTAGQEDADSRIMARIFQ